MVLPLHRAPVPRWGVILGVEVGIRPILSSVALNIRQILKLTISLVLLGQLSGCGAIGGAALSGALMGGSLGSLSHYSPQILCTTEDSIGVSYHRDAWNSQHNGAMQLITEHCVGEYVETKRVDSFMGRAVYATCLQADGSPAVSQPCEYNAEEVIGFGQSGTEAENR